MAAHTASGDVPRTLRTLSLQRRLALLMGAGLVMMLVIIGIGVYYFTYQTERETWDSRQREAASNASRIVSLFMHQNQAALALLSWPSAFELKLQPDILGEVIRQQPGILEIVRLDAKGQVAASAARDEVVLANLFTVPQSQWFQVAAGGELYMGDVQLSASNQPYLIMALPARDGGVTAARLSMQVLWDVVKEIRFGETGTALIANQSGRVIAHTNTELVLSGYSLEDHSLLSSALRGATADWQGSYRNFGGKSVRGVLSPVQGTPWIVVAELYQSEIHANSRLALILLGSGLLLLGMIMLGIVAFFLRRYVFFPLRHLRIGTERISQGDLRYRVAVARGDELGRLGQAFNEMAVSLEARDTELAAQARELRIAGARAKESARLKGEFLANMSHELRTPLNAIIGFSDMLLMGMSGELTEKQRHKVLRLRENGTRLLALVNDILDITRIEARRIEIIARPFSPYALLERLSAQMQILAENRGLKFLTAIDPAMPVTLNGDEKRIEQVIVNLLSNAFKFTEEGQVALTFQVDHAAGTWKIAVSDSGIGIPPHAKDIIFEEFRQLDGSSSRAYKGSGLGLAITRNLVRMMDGQIDVQTELGKGSTFTVTFPLLREPQPEPAVVIPEAALAPVEV